jgi:hypothetical protein
MDEFKEILEEIKEFHVLNVKSKKAVWSSNRKAKYIKYFNELTETLTEYIHEHPNENHQENIKRAKLRLQECKSIITSAKLSSKENLIQEPGNNLHSRPNEEGAVGGEQDFEPDFEGFEPEPEKLREQEIVTEAESESEVEEEEKEVEKEQEDSSSDSENMVAFNYDTASRLPILSKTGSEETRDFLNAVESYWEFLDEAGKSQLVKYVVQAKIIGPAKTKIGSAVPTTLSNLKTLLKTKCGATESIESLSVKLQTLKQQQKSAEEYAAELEGLAEKISEIEISKSSTLADDSAKEAIRTVYKRQALTTFQRGLNDKDVRTAVIAARSGDLSEALLVAISAKAAEQAPEPKIKSESESLFLNAKTDKCYNCNKSGHFARDCRSRPQNNSNQGQGQQGWQQGRGRGSGRRGRGGGRGGGRGTNQGQGRGRGQGGQNQRNQNNWNQNRNQHNWNQNQNQNNWNQNQNPNNWNQNQTRGFYFCENGPAGQNANFGHGQGPDQSGNSNNFSGTAHQTNQNSNLGF